VFHVTPRIFSPEILFKQHQIKPHWSSQRKTCFTLALEMCKMPLNPFYFRFKLSQKTPRNTSIPREYQH